MKRIGKRLLMLTLAMAFVMGLMIPQASAGKVASGTCGKGVKWSLSSDGTLTVSGKGKMDNYYRSAPTPWEKHWKKIKKIKVKKGVTRIGGYAFDGCSNLKSLSIAGSVTKIDTAAFSDCPLKSITLPNGLKTIGPAAFSGSKLKKVVLPKSLKTIDEGAFWHCTALESITIPSGVKKIGYGAFEDCSNLNEITIPKNVKTIEGDAFNGCKKLKSVALSEGLKTIGDGAFCLCPNLKSISVPKSVSSIGARAFGYGTVSGFDNYMRVKDFVVIGYAGTAAEDYAYDNGFEFREQ